MRRAPATAHALASLAAYALLATASPVRAQSIEPRSLSNAPVGTNFLIAGYAFTKGSLAFDTSVPISDVNIRTSSSVLGYVRALDFWGKSAKFDTTVAYTWLNGSADFAGSAIQRQVSGFTDPQFRLSVNWYGAPALRLKEFHDYTQDMIVGTYLQVTVPAGQYDRDRVVNIGSHRWSFKAAAGVSKVLGQWTLESGTSVTFFTDNKEFFGGTTRSQDPLYAIQTNVIYSFKSGVWASLGGTYYMGGRSNVDGVLNPDLQQNWRVGATLALPVNARNSIKLNVSSGVSARTGNNYDQYAVYWQYYWGGGF